MGYFFPQLQRRETMKNFADPQRDLIEDLRYAYGAPLDDMNEDEHLEHIEHLEDRLFEEIGNIDPTDFLFGEFDHHDLELLCPDVDEFLYGSDDED